MKPTFAKRASPSERRDIGTGRIPDTAEEIVTIGRPRCRTNGGCSDSVRNGNPATHEQAVPASKPRAAFTRRRVANPGDRTDFIDGADSSFRVRHDSSNFCHALSMQSLSRHEGDGRLLTVSRYESLESLEELEPEWNAFLTTTSASGFFLTWIWVHAWCRASAERYAPFVIVARDESGAIVGVAPLAIERETRILTLLGQSFWGQFVEFAVESGREYAAMDALCIAIASARGSAWNEVHFRFVGANSTFEQRLFEAFARGGIALCEVEVQAAPFTDLPDDIDAYYAGRSEHFAKRIRYIERRLGREGAVEFRVCDSVADVDEAFAVLVDMYAKRWGVPMEPDFSTFLYGLATELVPKRQVLLVGLYVNDIPVGASYDWIHEGRVLGNVWGWDPAWSTFEIGNILIARTLRLAIDRDYTVYDMLSGDASYKRRWGTRIRSVVELVSVRGVDDGIEPNDDGSVARGHIDEVKVIGSDLREHELTDTGIGRAGRLLIRGWIAPPSDADDRLYAFAQFGERRYALSLGMERSDVATALDDRSLSASGFRGILALSESMPAHQLVRVGIGRCATGSEYYLADGFEIVASDASP